LTSLAACAGNVPDLDKEIERVKDKQTTTTLVVEQMVKCYPVSEQDEQKINGMVFFSDPNTESPEEYYSRMTSTLEDPKFMIGVAACTRDFTLDEMPLLGNEDTPIEPTHVRVEGDFTNISGEVVESVNYDDCVITGLMGEISSSEELIPLRDKVGNQIVEVAC
ncbi:MAG: hypothetical protein Q7T41_02790, partial [Candidatus Saccharibacteria bacterium]|nr:hypothetical protein [Candidatus Saccharibacteria bacterium]